MKKMLGISSPETFFFFRRKFDSGRQWRPDLIRRAAATLIFFLLLLLLLQREDRVLSAWRRWKAVGGDASNAVIRRLIFQSLSFLKDASNWHRLLLSSRPDDVHNWIRLSRPTTAVVLFWEPACINKSLKGEQWTCVSAEINTFPTRLFRPALLSFNKFASHQSGPSFSLPWLFFLQKFAHVSMTTWSYIEAIPALL